MFFAEKKDNYQYFLVEKKVPYLELCNKVIINNFRLEKSALSGTL